MSIYLMESLQLINTLYSELNIYLAVIKIFINWIIRLFIFICVLFYREFYLEN